LPERQSETKTFSGLPYHFSVLCVSCPVFVTDYGTLSVFREREHPRMDDNMINNIYETNLLFEKASYEDPTHTIESFLSSYSDSS